MNSDEYNLMEYARSVHINYLATDAKLNAFPKGTLVIHKERNRIYYYCQNKNSRTYLSKTKNATEIEALKQKRDSMPALSKNAEESRRILSILRPIVKKILQKHRVAQFKYAESKKKTYRDGLIVSTKFGLMVRSKSEAAIANWFYDHAVPFEYEPSVQINGYEFNPDFRFKHPLKGKLFYLEHLGLSDGFYLEKWERKKKAYFNAGIIEGINLFTTNEENLRKMYEIFADEFTLSRYADLLQYLGLSEFIQ